MISHRILYQIWEFSQHWPSPSCSLLTSCDALDTQAKSWTFIDIQAAFISWDPDSCGVLCGRRVLCCLYAPTKSCLLIWEAFLRLHTPSLYHQSFQHLPTLPWKVIPIPSGARILKILLKGRRKSRTQRQNAWCFLNRGHSLAINTYFADEFIIAPPKVTWIN